MILLHCYSIAGGVWYSKLSGGSQQAFKGTDPKLSSVGSESDGGRRRIQAHHLGAGKWLVEGISERV